MKKMKKYQNNAILNEHSPFLVKEAYKGTRTNIEFSITGEGCKYVMVGSAKTQEGKTTTCVNLAITFAETGAKVVVVDGDLRKPQIHGVLKGYSRQGLSDVLAGFAELGDVLEMSSYANLDFVGAGSIPPNPSELLGSPRMKQVLEQLGDKYDYVFIDTPPLNLVTDGCVIAPQVSGVVMVVRQNQTKQKDIQQAVQNLSKVGAKVIGTILNDKKMSKSQGKRFGKYSKYGEYVQPVANA